MLASFVHLRLHTEFSLSDSVVRIGALVGRLKALEQPACGITDITNFYGLIKFYTKCESGGIKPIVGADFQLADEDGNPTLLTLLAMNKQGYKNITELISRAWQHGQHHGVAMVQRSWVSEHADGVIALSGARFGDVGKALLAGRAAQAVELAEAWQRDFPNRFYLELTRTGRENEENYLHQAVALAEQLQFPVVATNDVRFLSAEEYEVHEARVCIGEGRALDDPRRERRFSEQQYLRSSEEMAELFSDIPEAIANTVEIAKRCNVHIQLGDYFLPDYPIPDDIDHGAIFERYSREFMHSEAVNAMAGNWAGKENTPEYAQALRVNFFFQKVTYEGLEWRLARILDQTASDYQARRQLFVARLKFELDIIMQMGFPGYFLIVMDFIRWAKDNDIPVGPGRGSGAGSLVAYAQKITDLDPLEYDLLFERFLNPERVSMPDFDVDFCMENRDRVISYVADKYGRDAVSQIITFGTMAAKAVVRDVARVQGKSYGLADKLSKMIPPDPGMTLAKALESEEILREFLATDSEAHEIWEMAVRLEGLTRNVGKHAGGVVIAPTKLTDFAPLYCDEAGGGLVTQFDKNDVEAAGLVKFDFLGLRTLTIIDWAVKMINRDRRLIDAPLVDISALPLDDEPTFKLLRRAETTAVFQLESRGMKDLIKRLQPDNLEDLIALVALFRPGPLQSGMVDDFINRKHGRAKVAYPDAQYQHESLQPILEPTYGVIVYQEQVMQIAQVLAGYTLGGADMLRRAMGKKKPEEMAKQRSTFEGGAASQGIDPNLAMKIFDLVEKFAGYGFNKSHSAAYALVSYQTAWLKTHYPAHFMAATISSDMDKTDKVVTFIEECREMGLMLLPPDVNSGEFMFNVNPDGHIVYGLGAIKGLGEGPVENIIVARTEGGPFTSLFDFCARVDPRKVNKRALEALVRSGAFDTIGPQLNLDYDRAVLMAAMTEAVKAAEQSHANASAGMMDLFGEVVPTATAENDDVYSEFRGVRSLTMRERLEGERDTLGLYLTGHPIDEYHRELKYLVSNRIADLKPEKSTQRIAGLVVAMRVMKTKRGDTMAFVSLDDRSGRIEIALFADTYNNYRDKVVKDALLVIEGQVSHDDYSGQLKVRAETINTLSEARAGLARGIHMEWQGSDINDRQLDTLLGLLNNHRGGNCPITVDFRNHIARGRVHFGKEWQVNASEELLTALREVFGVEKVRMVY